jgi:glutamyl endopeptidase
MSRPAATTPKAGGRKTAAAALPLLRPSRMLATNGGGRLEQVPGFNAVRARSEGFRGGRVPAALRDRRLGVAGDIEFARPQFTFGNDDRVLISDASALPWRCVCQLVVEGLFGQEVLGTGWLAGPHTVITAGHNLFSPSTGRQASKVWVMPGRAGDAVPYGLEATTQCDVHPMWRGQGDRNFDVGVVWLDAPMGEQLGWFGIGAYSDAQLRGLIVNNAGYPADKPLGTQWFNAGRVLSAKPQALTYGLDTEPGQSGSPIFHFTEDEQRIVVAVHAYGDSGENIGVRITANMLGTLAGWVR